MLCNRRRFPRIRARFLAGSCLLHACSSVGSSNTSSGSPDAAVDRFMFPEAAADRFMNLPDGEAGPGSCGCSSDLHSVVGPDGTTVVQQCAADQGCAECKCVPACEAATSNRSSIGCEYYAVAAKDLFMNTCFVAFISNTWGSPVTVSVDYAGKPLTGIAYSTEGSGLSLTYAPLPGNVVPPGGIALLFLGDDGGWQGLPARQTVATSCPAGVNVGVHNGVGTWSKVGGGSDTKIADAFHITTNAPIVAYDIASYGIHPYGSTSATLLLPTSAWGDNYVVTTGWGGPNSLDDSPSFSAPRWIAFVAREDGTSIDINPTADIQGGAGVTATPKNVTQTYSLNKGQMLTFGQLADLSGTVAKANHPVGAWGGNTLAEIWSLDGDGPVRQQLPPISAMGSEYVAVRYRNRNPNPPSTPAYPPADEAPPWHLVGVVDGTALTYDPPVPGAPAILNRGDALEIGTPDPYATDWDTGGSTLQHQGAAGPFVVKSQDKDHPFYFGAHMTGNTMVPKGNELGVVGASQWVNVVASDEYLKSYVFFTDPALPETNLVLVRQRGADGAFHDVELDCAGTLSGWQPVGSSGRYQYTRQDLQTGNFEKVGACDNGRHEAHSDAPFALTVWGWGSRLTHADPNKWCDCDEDVTENAAYAYPAGMSLAPVNSVVVVPPPK